MCAGRNFTRFSRPHLSRFRKTQGGTSGGAKARAEVQEQGQQGESGADRGVGREHMWEPEPLGTRGVGGHWAALSTDWLFWRRH